MPSKFKSGYEGVTRRPAVDSSKKERMMAVLLRNRTAFDTVKDLLTPGKFNEFDKLYALVWQIACDYVASYDELPPSDLVKVEAEAACDANPLLLNAVEHQQLSDFIQFAYDPDSFDRDVTTDTGSGRWAVKTIQAYLEEQLQTELRTTFQSKTLLPSDFPGMIAQMVNKAEQIAAATTKPAQESYPTNWHESAKLETFPTGVPFITAFLGTGHAPGEVYGLMGPYGSCKTLLACMLGVEAARFFQKKPGKPKLSFIVSYEADMKELRSRTIGYAARIPRDSLEKLNSNCALTDSGLSKAGCLKDYEKIIYKDKLLNGKKVDGELDRAELAITQFLRPHLVLLDMTGAEVKGVGNGGIKEIQRFIQYYCNQRDADCGCVVVDYIGAMARRYMAAHDIDNDQLRHQIGGAPLMLKSNIASYFKCPVWAMHQFSGEANHFSPGRLADHTYASEAKNFAENLDFCLSVGKPHEEYKVARFGCTKHRRRPAVLDTLIAINGAMNSADGCDKDYCLHNGAIMRIDDFNKIPEATGKKKPVANNVLLEDE